MEDTSTYCVVCERAIGENEKPWAVNRNLGEGHSLSWPTVCESSIGDFKTRVGQ